MTVAFTTFGCRLNHAEALDAEARIAAAGHATVPLDDAAPPDFIVVRGCSITAKAQRDCERAIARLRLRFPSSCVVPTGCLPDAAPLPAELAAPPAGRADAAVPMRTSRAYLKVQDGCSCNCAYCIVPAFRGRPTSVPFTDAIARASAFLAAGFREIVVTGCNLALYRDSGRRLPDLVSALAELPCPAPHRVRLGSIEPGLCDGGLLDALAAHPNVCRFIHLSLQSASDSILKRMGRPYSASDVERFCAEARKRLGPRLALGCDMIAGFPGETADDHAATRDFLARHAFTNVHAFPYSERPGTPAATMAGAVPTGVRRVRAKELDGVGRSLRAAFTRTFRGQTVEVCVERDGNGWTGEYLRCILPPGLPRRSLVRLRVESARHDILRAFQ